MSAGLRYGDEPTNLAFAVVCFSNIIFGVEGSELVIVHGEHVACIEGSEIAHGRPVLALPRIQRDLILKIKRHSR